MTTDTSEKGLEGLIVRSMTGRVDLLSPPYVANETSTPVAGGTGWILGDPKHYDRGACVDLVQLRGFLMATQPELVDKLSLETDTPTRRQFLARLDKELARRGVVDVLRKGIEHQAHHVTLFYGTPSPGNATAVNLHATASA
jgi:type I restriction enzyme R subunit